MMSAIETPEVKIMEADDLREFRDHFAKLAQRIGIGIALQEESRGLPHLASHIERNKNRNRDTENRIQPFPLEEINSAGAKQNSDPAEHVFNQMPAQHFLVMRVPVAELP